MRSLKVTGLGRLPTKGHNNDCGFDLYTHNLHHLAPNSFTDVDLGICVEMPEDCWGMLTGRSSTIRQRGLLVVQGIIDAGYRGPLYAAVWNMNNAWVDVSDGDRLAQLIPMLTIGIDWKVERVESLSSSERGTKGFGSTGQ